MNPVTRKTDLRLSTWLLMLGALPCVVMFITLMVFFTSARLQDARDNLESSSQLLADSLAPVLEYAVVSGNTGALEQILEKSLHRSDATWIRVTDVTGDEVGVISRDSTPRQSRRSGFNIYSAEILQEPLKFPADGALFNSQWTAGDSALRVGTVEVGVDSGVLTSRRAEILWSSLIVGGVVLVFTVILVQHFLGNTLNPVRQLSTRVTRLIQGDYREQPAYQSTAREIREIQEQLNELAGHLHRTESDRERTLRLSETAREKAENASEAKSEFLTVISDELRTPLQGVYGILELVSREPLTKRQRDYLGTARQSTEDLLTVISDIVEYAGVDGIASGIKPQAFDLRSLLDNCTASFRLAAEHKEMALEILFAGNWPQPAMVQGDPARLRQVFAGFLNNALSFSNQGVIRVRAHLIAVDDEQVHLTCSIDGTSIGPGADGPVRSNALSLSVLQHLVELMGGYVQIGGDGAPEAHVRFELTFLRADGTSNAPDHDE